MTKGATAADPHSEVLDSGEAAVGGGISIAFDPLRLREIVGVLARPRKVAAEISGLTSDLVKVGLGLSEITVPDRDPLYADPAWRTHSGYRRLAQGHLALTAAIERIAHDPNATWHANQRARYVSNILTAGLSPANLLLTNPVATRRAIETGGLSVARGVRNLARDLRRNKRMPATVDARPYRVGVNIGATPGAVVYREDMFEILQYTPTTPEVHQRPLLFVPPELNRHYVLDLAPGRSMVEYALAHGMQTFMVVWRNPRKDPALRHGFWSLEDYLSAHMRAFDVVREITGSDDLNLIGLCAGGMTSALVQALLAARGPNPIHAATYLVTMLDAREPNMVTMMATPEVVEKMTQKAAKGDVVDSLAVAHNFAWMRPKDLVYSYVVNNWLLGNDPPAFDVLAWNADATNMSSTFSRDSNALLASGALVSPGAATLLGTPVDLRAIKSEAFVVAGLRDHITTWRPCYASARMFGGSTEMVVVNSGHIQSFVNPAGSSRYRYWCGSPDLAAPDAWLAQAAEHEGSWWPHWIAWLRDRSGTQRDAPTTLGSTIHRPREAAPGRYVHEK